MAIANGRYLNRYRVELVNKTVMNISNDYKEPLILEDEDNMKVYLPGTTMAGAFRSYISDNYNVKLAEEMFGANNNISKVFVYDSYSELKSYEIRPAVCIDKFTGASKDKGKFDRSYVAAGHKFKLNLEVYSDTEDKREEYREAIYSTLAAVNNGDIMIGSYKSIGAGCFEIECVQEEELDLHNKNDLLGYLLRKDKYKNLDKDKILNKKSSNVVTFELLGHLKTPILVKGYDSLDYTRPDGENMRAKDKYFIPGSTIKGVIRNEAERVLKSLNKVELVDDIFGVSKKNGEKSASKIRFFDTNIDKDLKSIYNRIKIDKFTGGVRKTALLNDEPLMGDVKIIGKYRYDEDNMYSKSEVGLLSVIFKNIAIGEISFGGGTSIGRGRIDGKMLEIKKGDEVLFKYDFEKEQCDNNLNEYIAALTSLQGGR